MPASYSFDDRIVVMRLVGEYTPADLKQRILEALDDPACPPRPVLMFDQRGSISLKTRTPDEVRDMANFLAKHAERFQRTLAMVTDADVSYGLMRIGVATVEASGVRAEVFREFAEARAWLLEPLQAPPNRV